MIGGNYTMPGLVLSTLASSIKCKEIRSDGVVAANADGEDVFYPADTLTHRALGLESKKTLVDELRKTMHDFYAIGDCTKVACVMQAICTGYDTCVILDCHILLRQSIDRWIIWSFLHNIVPTDNAPARAAAVSSYMKPSFIAFGNIFLCLRTSCSWKLSPRNGGEIRNALGTFRHLTRHPLERWFGPDRSSLGCLLLLHQPEQRLYLSAIAYGTVT